MPRGKISETPTFSVTFDKGDKQWNRLRQLRGLANKNTNYDFLMLLLDIAEDVLVHKLADFLKKKTNES